MASDDTSGAKPAGPVALRIKLRYDDVDAMVSRFAGNVGRSGLFLPTRSLHPVGTEVKFELRMESYNTLNAFTGDNPVLTITSPSFGQIIGQRPGTFGRQIQYTGRIIF